jgi:DNA repair protein RadC
MEEILMKLNQLKGQMCLVEIKSNAAKELERSYSCILKERLNEYGVDNLLDEEILCLLTGISIDVIKKAIDDFGLLELTKYSSSLNITKVQRKKLELLIMYYKRMSFACHKEKPILNSPSKAGEYP